MATLGTIMTSPEAGYKRIDNTSSFIKYRNGWTVDAWCNYSSNATAYYIFKFYGTKFCHSI